MDKDEIILSVRLRSGTFEASVSVPINDGASESDFNDVVARWLALTATALKHGVSEMRATLTKEAT